jgi:predicted TIM-barrel fold metal-dependent hydrolase
MTLIDSHFHVNYNGFSSIEIIKYLDRERIDYCWLLSWEEIDPGPWDYQHLAVDDIYDAFLKYSSRIIPFYAPDPHRDDVVSQMEKWSQKGIRGYGELKATINWNSEKMIPILKTARRLKMPIVFHMEENENRDIPYSDKLWDKILFYGVNNEKKILTIPRKILLILTNNFAPLKNRKQSYYFPGYMLDFASLEARLQDYPDVNFVAHGLMFWKYISSDAANYKDPLPKNSVNGDGIIWRLLKGYPNLYADTSGPSGLNALTRDPAATKRFLSMFEDKILFGTDNCDNSMKRQKDYLRSLELPEYIYKKIYGDNAYRLLH